MRTLILLTFLGIYLFSFATVEAGVSKELLLAGKLEDLNDREPIAEPPESTPNDMFDFLDRTLFKQVRSWFDVPRNVRWLTGNPKQALNIDAFDEVPNSSWFTNRAHKLSTAEVLRGPDTGTGPAMGGPWSVIGAKTEGVTPGFFIRDALGDRYVLKFDPLTNPEMATGAEIISTKLFYAMGYNVPENYLVFFEPNQLAIGDNVMFTDSFGRQRRLNPDDVRHILERVPRMADGSIRAIASRFLSGIPKGPYSYIGTNSDDPNDVYRHEHRRELRGLHVVAAFTNHNDIRRINSLDVFVADGYLKHFLIDFGSTLGSASIAVNLPSEGFEYQFDFSELTRSLLGAGLYKRKWQRVNLESGLPSIGYWGSEGFHPEKWKPNYPNMAFQRMTDWDGFWGARLVMTLSDEEIWGIVRQAQYTDPRAAAHMARTLIDRRDMTGRYWFARVNPLDRFVVSNPAPNGQAVHFNDLALDAGFHSQEDRRYQYSFSHLNFGGGDEAIGGPLEMADSTAIPIPSDLLREIEAWCQDHGATDAQDRIFYFTIRSRQDSEPTWGDWTKVYLHYSGLKEGLILAGIERQD